MSHLSLGMLISPFLSLLPHGDIIPRALSDSSAHPQFLFHVCQRLKTQDLRGRLGAVSDPDANAANYEFLQWSWRVHSFDSKGPRVQVRRLFSIITRKDTSYTKLRQELHSGYTVLFYIRSMLSQEGSFASSLMIGRLYLHHARNYIRT